ncbi:sensor histidine kinase [Micromonospora sp. LOL_024]|uniref:sensor histidine kinase n=1 Tax=Micromonospora sp. LOL_024 TaxID=3345412 RepID=UPI003A8B7CDB
MVRTLRGQVVGVVAALALLAVMMVTTVVALATDRALGRALDRQATVQSTVLQEMTAAGTEATSWPETADAARSLADKFDVRITVTSAELTPYLDTGSGPLPSLVGVIDPYGPLGDAAVFNKNQYRRAVIDCFHRRGIRYTDSGSELGPMVVSGRSAAALECYEQAKATASVKKSGIKEPALLFVSSTPEASIPWGMLALIGALVVVAAVAAAVPLSRVLTGSLTRVVEATEAIRRGQGDARVEVKSPAEIAELATSFNAMADELATVERRRRQQTADVAHELRSPLTTIRNYVDALQEGVLPLTRENLAVVDSETTRLTQLVDDLAVIALLDDGTLPLHLTSIDVQTLVDAAIRARRLRANAAGITLAVCGQAPSTLADPKRVSQIVGNLLDNALEHTPVNGRIDVVVGAGQAAVTVDVRDTGSGMDAADLDRVFDRLWRADPSRSSHTGYGLGLPLARGLAHAHGGTLTAVNQSTGGAQFTLTLPYRDTSDPRPPTPANSRTPTANWSTWRK